MVAETGEKQTLLLVDGSSYLYRAFHALPDLRSRSGAPTGAVYGVVGMLRRLRDDNNLNQGAKFGAVVFDAPGKTFRDALYPDYKATRREMPADLVQQLSMIDEMVAALGWPLLKVPAVEADDVLGTLAVSAQRWGWQTVIATADKDLAQLVNEEVRLLNTTVRGGTTWLDAEGVKAKFGVGPSLIVDWLALVGDPVDNIPGVPGVGPKTAAKWLLEYGSLDALVAQADHIKGAVGERLRGALSVLGLAKQLASVRCDLDVLPAEAPHDFLALQAPDAAVLRRLFEQADFQGWLRELDAHGSSAVESVAEDAVELSWVTGVVPLQRLLEQASEMTALELHVTSHHPMQARLLGVAISITPRCACYVPLSCTGTLPLPANTETEICQIFWRLLKAWIENPAFAKVVQDAKFCRHVFENHGIQLLGQVHDVSLESYVLASHQSHTLKALAQRYLNRRFPLQGGGAEAGEIVSAKEGGAKKQARGKVNVQAADAVSAGQSASVLVELHKVLQAQLSQMPALESVYQAIELPVARVLQVMERNGVLVDVQVLADQSEDLERSMAQLSQSVFALSGEPFNLGSPKQLAHVLFEKLGLPILKKTPGGEPSTDEGVLAQLALQHPLPEALLAWRSLAKLKNTYTDKLPKMVDPESGRIHTCYAQTVAATGRLSSVEPNLQNIPIRTLEGRRIRQAFVARPGWQIVSADYSQIELRIMAHLSADAALQKAFSSGQDVHAVTAGEVFGVPLAQVSADQRRAAKAINFGLIYGMSVFGLASNLGISQQAAKAYMERYFNRYPGVAEYMERTRVLARQNGYVETLWGRRLWLPEIKSGNGPRRAAQERAAINAPMQGTAADLIKLAMVGVQNWIQKQGMQSLLIMQVHDELVLEVCSDELISVMEQVPILMRQVASLAVSLEVQIGVGANWDEAH